MSLQAGDEAHNTKHGTHQEGLECLACFEDIDGSNYVEYTAVQDGPWLPSLFCQECVEYLLKSQWEAYVKQLSAASCKAEQTHLLERGPPTNLRDPSALPCPDDGEVVLLWFAVDGIVKSAKLDGSLEGRERQGWWDDKLNFQFDEPEDEPAEPHTRDSGESEEVTVVPTQLKSAPTCCTSNRHVHCTNAFLGHAGYIYRRTLHSLHQQEGYCSLNANLSASPLTAAGLVEQP